MNRYAMLVVPLVGLAACAQTQVQPLNRMSFKIDTVADCGPAVTRDIAFEAAAIEVIKRGRDRFVIVDDRGGPGKTTVAWNPYIGLQSYTDDRQSMVVVLLDESDPNHSLGLSARETLGTDWQAIVARGSRRTCAARGRDA